MKNNIHNRAFNTLRYLRSDSMKLAGYPTRYMALALRSGAGVVVSCRRGRQNGSQLIFARVRPMRKTGDS